MKKKGLSRREQSRMLGLYSRLEETLNINPQGLTRKYRDEVVMKVRALEKFIQRAWGFDYDPTRFYYEFKLKGCECPLQDNIELLGTNYRHYDSQCPWHGAPEFYYYITDILTVARDKIEGFGLERVRKDNGNYFTHKSEAEKVLKIIKECLRE